MRHSTAYSLAGRPSHIGSVTAQNINPNTNARILEKRKEYEALQALERSSSEYVRRMKALAQDCEVMADGGKVFGEVMAQWPHMFRILNLYMSSMDKGDFNEDDNAGVPEIGERLVRIPLDALQEATTERDGRL